MTVLVVLALLAWVVPTMAWAQKVPVGSEFQVNAYSTGNQGYYRGADVASDAAGNFFCDPSSSGGFQNPRFFGIGNEK